MKRIVPYIAVMVAPVWLCALAAAHGVLHRNSPATPATPWLVYGQSNVVDIPFAAGNPPFQALTSAGKTGLKAQGLPPAASLHPPFVRPSMPPKVFRGAASNHFVGPSVPPKLRPGVYKTEPYSCIVVVPGPHPDDRCVINPGGGDSSMPIIKPDLRFIPLAPAPTR